MWPVSETPPDGDVIDLAVPCTAEYASTMRVVVASIGADLDFTVDEIDDLRLGVSEVFTLLADTDRPARCVASFVLDGDAVEITLSRDLDDDVIELDGLASTILGSVVDEHAVTDRGVVLKKRGAGARRDDD